MKPHCEFFSLVVFKQTTPNTVLMKRLRCGSWQCPYCAKENRRLWADHLKRRLPQVSPTWWFITLTAHQNKRTPENSLDNIRSNIDRLFKRLRRIYAKIDYVRVYEVHKQGAFHAHLVVSGLSERVQAFTSRTGAIGFRATVSDRGNGNWSIKTWLSRTCHDLQMGYKVDVQKVAELSQVVRYVVKYLTKAAQNFTVRNLRRVQTSQRVGGLRRRGDGTWRVAARVFRQSVPPGAHLYDADKRLQIPDTYWQSHLTYPEPN